MQMVHEVLQAGMEKDRLRTAYFRLAATYAMVEVRRVIRCLHNRDIEAQRDDAVQRYCSVISAETIIAALMAGASARHTMRKHRAWRAYRHRHLRKLGQPKGSPKLRPYHATFTAWEVRRNAAVAIVSTLTTARCRTATGVSERQLYRAVCALQQHVAEEKDEQVHRWQICHRSTESGDRCWRTKCIRQSSYGMSTVLSILYMRDMSGQVWRCRTTSGQRWLQHCYQ